MAEPDGTQADPLITRLSAAPYAAEFTQAVRRLESAHRDKPRIGASSRAADDPVRFGQDPSMEFSPAEMSSVTVRPERPPRIALASFGLLGPNGPLPLHLTAFARDRERAHKDFSLVHFLDMLTHRFTSLFYRAWAVNQKTVSYDRPESDRWMTYLGSLEGLGQASLRDRDRLPDAAKLFYAGRLSPQSKSASGLRDVLADFFGVPVAIEEFVGQWVDLPADCRCRLGQARSSGEIGRSVVVGSRVWDCQMKFRIRIGPMRLADFERFLPGTPARRRLRDWVKLYTADELEWDAQLLLLKEEVPALKLGQSGRLGWTTWIGAQPHARDADQVILSSAVA